METYGPDVMTRSKVFKWVKEFKEGRTDTHDEERSGRPSVVLEELVQQVNEKIRSDRRVTLDSLHEMFPHISRTVMGEIVSEKLDYRKCARWVPKMIVCSVYCIRFFKNSINFIPSVSFLQQSLHLDGCFQKLYRKCTDT